MGRSTRRRALTGSLVVVSSLAACGGDDDAGGPPTTLSDDPVVGFCQLIQRSVDVEPDGEESPEELETKLAELRPLLSQIAEAAPAEISDEIEASVGAQARLIDLVAAADYDLDAVDDEQMGELSAEIEGNSGTIQDWINGHCDF